MARFPASAIPVTGYHTSFDFWSAIAEKVANGVLPDGRRELLTNARLVYPYSTTLPELPIAAAQARPANSVQAEGLRGAQIGDHNVQVNYFDAPPASRRETAPLRVLVIGASPSDPDLPHVRADREAHVIDEVAQPGRVEVRAVLGAEATDMQKVRSFRPDILHFACHGEDDCLVFNDTRGEADRVKATRISDLLRHYRDTDGVRLRAIVLAACDGNTLTPLFADVADAVIGHGGKLSDPCGEAFARHFYRLISNGSDNLAAAAREAAQLAAQFSAGCAPVVANLIIVGDEP